VLRVENVWKSFSGVPVLRDVSFDVRQGEVHALAGANGAGKSTLVNIISGVLQPDRGSITWDGKTVRLKNPREGRDLGISFVHQELAIVPQLSVGENIFLGRHPRSNGFVKLGPDSYPRPRTARIAGACNRPEASRRRVGNRRTAAG
jgi:ABC-type sugar transport system ATPase subunit